jgi:hypothetical protein
MEYTHSSSSSLPVHGNNGGGGDNGGAMQDVHGSHHVVGRVDDFTQFSTSTGSHNVNVALWNLAIQDACCVIDTLEDLVANEDIPIEHHDTESNNAMLYCWMKLAMLRQICESHKYGGSLSTRALSTIQSIPDRSIVHGDAIDDDNEYDDYNDDNDNVPPKSLLHRKSLLEVVQVMEEKLKDMEHAYFAKKSNALKPNIYSYNYVLRALTLHGSDSLERVKWYLRRMEKTEDDIMKGVVEIRNGSYEEDLPPTTAFADSVS